MRKFGTLTAAFLIVIILVVVEIIIIKGISKYEPQSVVVFAKVRIPEKTLITTDMLEVKKIGTGLVHGLSMGNIKEAAGRRTKMDIEAGEMILSAKLGYEGMEKIEVKDRNKRLFSVEFKGDQANGWQLMAGQYADIIFVPNDKAGQPIAGSPGSGSENKLEITQNSAGNKVQKLKSIRIAALIDDNGKLLKNKDRAALPKYISFEVTEDEADFLAYAKSNGRLEASVIPN